jgi:hypothetical protein
MMVLKSLVQQHKDKQQLWQIFLIFKEIWMYQVLRQNREKFTLKLSHKCRILP